MQKPCSLELPQDKFRARVAKNFLLVTVMSLDAGYGPLIEDYQPEPNDTGLNSPALNSVSLTGDELQDRHDLL